LDKLETICQNGGTTLANLLQVRALVTQPNEAFAVYAALRKAIPSAPPVVCMIVVESPLYVSGCSVALDAVAYVEGF
jgi:hypothetical protein